MSLIETPYIADYLHRPGREYRLAFDRAVASLSQPGGQALAVLSSPLHAVELLKRCMVPLYLGGTGAFDPGDFAHQMRGWAWSPLHPAALDEGGERFQQVLWAEPEVASASTVAQDLFYAARPGCRLFVIASSLLRHRLPVWQQEPYPALDPLPPRRARQILERAGWVFEGQTAFHSPRAVAWSLLFRAASLLARPDWSDRCLLSMRAHYEEDGWLASLSPLALIRARRV